jgi:hypothetical protein
MATKSARTSALFERRQVSKIKLLAPANTSISSIAKQTISAELDTMINRYNDGQVGNSEMKDFLNRMLTTPGVSISDKTQIEDKLRDFDTLIQKDKLEATFKAAPEGSITQVQAATALAEFYKQRAATMVTGTPAQSTALENASTWDAKVTSIGDTMAKTARTNQRYIQEQQINQMPSGSSERIMASAQAYQNLYEQALADGDTVAANQYLAKVNDLQTKAQEVYTKEGEQAATEEKKNRRTEIVNYVNTLANAYHDGQITATEFAQAIPNIEAAAVDIGDTSIQLSLNRWADTLAKDMAKGVKRGSIEGLPVVLGKGGAGGTGQGTDWDMQDHNYSDNLRIAQEALKAGKFNSQTYLKAVGMAVQEHAQQLAQRIQTIDAIASENPNAKVLYNGKKQRAEDILENLNEEFQSLDEQAGAVTKGNFALAEVPPASGAELGKGKSTVTYKIIDPTTLQENTMAQDDEGIYHPIVAETLTLTPEELASAAGSGVFYDTTGKYGEVGRSYFVSTDKSGNPSIKTGRQLVNVTGDDNKVNAQPYVQGQPVKSLNQIQKEAEQAMTVKKAEEVKQKQAVKDYRYSGIPAQPAPAKPNLLEQATGAVQQKVQEVAPALAQAPIPAIVQKATEVVKPVVQKAQEAIQQATPTLMQSPIQAVANKVQQAVPQIQLPNYNPVQTLQNNVTQAKNFITSIPQNISNAIQPAVQQVKQAVQPVVQKIATTIQQSPFDWLKKKLGW